MASDDVSIVTGKTKTFTVWDYVLFAAILVVSAGIGFYHAWKDRNKQTVKDFLLAGGNMQVLPVALSLLASFMSAITILGTPVEMYQYTTMYFYIGIGYILVMAGATHLYIPIFYRLKVTSAYEYLEKRFGKTVRTCGSMTFVIQMLLYMAIVLYAPSLALNAVTGFTLWGSIMSVGSVCTIYTAFGGMKAVLWTDTFQVFMMLAGLFAVLIKGSINVGGFQAAWNKMESSGRLLWDDLRPDPSIRHSFWALVFGGYFTWVAIYGVNQAMVQRACTCPTLKRAQLAMWLNVPGLCLILYLGCLIGSVVYAFYSECDPFLAGIIDSKDQLLPLFVMDVLGEIPGLPGLFVACLFSGALSTISSGLNSIAACILEDIIKAYIAPNISDIRATRATQILALVFGAVCLGLTYVASQLGNILQAALSLFGMLAGPLLGVFTLGMMLPWANKWGAITGLFTSLAVTFTMGVGNFIYQPPVSPPKSPVSTVGCYYNINSTLNFTTTTTTTTTLSTTTAEAPYIFPMFDVSYLWIGFFAVLTAVVVGLIVSFLTGFTDPSSLDPRLICPVFDILPPFCLMPESWRKPLRFGVLHKGKYEDDERLKQLEALGHITIADVFHQTLDINPDKNPDKTEDRHIAQISEGHKQNGRMSNVSMNGIVNPALVVSVEDVTRL